MAREHARIMCSVWRPGDDFRERSPDAQRLYFLLLSQRELNNAGVIPFMASKWARCSKHTDVEDVERALAELEANHYVVVDRDTEELLVRTFIRNDGIVKQPNMLKSALRLAVQIESEKLRHALAYELVRMGLPDTLATAAAIAPKIVRQASENPSPNPSTDPAQNPLANGSANPTSEPETNPSLTPEKNPSPSPAGWGGGRGRGKGSSSGGGSGGEEPAPPPNLDPDNPRCGDHAAIPATERGPACRACAAVRRQLEAAAATGDGPDAAARRAWRAAVDACPDCDENGMRELPDGSLTRHHSTLTGAPA